VNTTTNVTYFRTRRAGPESAIEDVVAQSIPQFLSPKEHSLWAAGSLPIGAGMPDLVIVAYHKQVSALTRIQITDAQILAYLRAVGQVRLDTIVDRIRAPRTFISRALDAFVAAEAVNLKSDRFSLSPLWRHILPEVLTIEVKVSNWQKAIQQARRNQIFSHRSFVALPATVADRISSAPPFRDLGIGLLSVQPDGTVALLRRPRRRQPTIWTYYYQLALVVARNSKN